MLRSGDVLETTRGFAVKQSHQYRGAHQSNPLTRRRVVGKGWCQTHERKKGKRVIDPAFEERVWGTQVNSTARNVLGKKVDIVCKSAPNPVGESGAGKRARRWLW